MLSWNLQSSYLDLPETFFFLIKTDPAPAPAWAIFNQELAVELGLGKNSDSADLEILSGTRPPPNAEVFAQAYAGHQFGHFNMLGDGRAAILGEVVDTHGQRWDIQLKGSGPTPYGRRGDGKAVLGPMLREYAIGEYLHAVGLPTSRVLSVVITGEPIWRDGWKPGGVLARAAWSHLRVGTFEYAAALDDRAALRALADYSIQRHYPDVSHAENPYAAFLDAVGEAQADLVARWMALGFVHGVMNTDNVSISGQALDFGPCAFLDTYRSDQVFSSIDTGGRYAWGRQSSVAAWNHARFAEAIVPLLHNDEEKALVLAQEASNGFGDFMRDSLRRSFGFKLGLSTHRDGDDVLTRDLLAWMESKRKDFTSTFRYLADHAVEHFSPDHFPNKAWFDNWQARLDEEPDYARVIDRANPRLHPRNRAVQAALDAAEAGHTGLYFEMVEQLKNPWGEETPELASDSSDESESPFVTFCGT